MGDTHWRYAHQHLGEPPLPDGQPILRPIVTVAVSNHPQVLLAVVDSGSPISVADATLFSRFGIDLAVDEPLFEVPLRLGGGFGRIPIYEVELLLVAPSGSEAAAIPWRLHLGARANWTLPFTILLGQRGWFNRYPTTIDIDSTRVETTPNLTERVA